MYLKKIKPKFVVKRALTVEGAVKNSIKEEIGGETLKTPERFAIEQKYGITDPFLIPSELAAIRAEVALG